MTLLRTAWCCWVVTPSLRVVPPPSRRQLAFIACCSLPGCTFIATSRRGNVHQCCYGETETGRSLTDRRSQAHALAEVQSLTSMIDQRTEIALLPRRMTRRSKDRETVLIKDLTRSRQKVSRRGRSMTRCSCCAAEGTAPWAVLERHPGAPLIHGEGHVCDWRVRSRRSVKQTAARPAARSCRGCFFAKKHLSVFVCRKIKLSG